MGRITGTSEFTFDLKDHEPYEVILAEDPELIDGSPQYGGDKRLQVTWQLPDGNSVRDWLSLKLGRQQNGQVSKLRALLNAASNLAENENIAWFDDETFEWGYSANGPAENVLRKGGTRVILRGTTTTNEAGQRRFAIRVYQKLAPF